MVITHSDAQDAVRTAVLPFGRISMTTCPNGVRLNGFGAVFTGYGR